MTHICGKMLNFIQYTRNVKEKLHPDWQRSFDKDLIIYCVYYWLLYYTENILCCPQCERKGIQFLWKATGNFYQNEQSNLSKWEMHFDLVMPWLIYPIDILRACVLGGSEGERKNWRPEAWVCRSNNHSINTCCFIYMDKMVFWG